MTLVSRLDRDLLIEPDAGTVIIDEGLMDLLCQSSSTVIPNPVAVNLANAYAALENQLSAFGVPMIIGPLTPSSEYANSAARDACTAAVDGYRNFANSLTGEPACLSANFDAAVSNGATWKHWPPPMTRETT